MKRYPTDIDPVEEVKKEKPAEAKEQKPAEKSTKKTKKS